MLTGEMGRRNRVLDQPVRQTCVANGLEEEVAQRASRHARLKKEHAQSAQAKRCGVAYLLHTLAIVGLVLLFLSKLSGGEAPNIANLYLIGLALVCLCAWPYCCQLAGELM